MPLFYTRHTCGARKHIQPNSHLHELKISTIYLFYFYLFVGTFIFYLIYLLPAAFCFFCDRVSHSDLGLADLVRLGNQRAARDLPVSISQQ